MQESQLNVLKFSLIYYLDIYIDNDLDTFYCSNMYMYILPGERERNKEKNN